MIEVFVLFKKDIFWFQVSRTLSIRQKLTCALCYFRDNSLCTEAPISWGLLNLFRWISPSFRSHQITPLPCKSWIKSVTKVYHLLSHDVKPFFILKKLVHLNDIGVIYLFENRNFVHEHLLFYLIDTCFLHDFHCPLWLGLPVNTESDLAKCT